MRCSKRTAKTVTISYERGPNRNFPMTGGTIHSVVLLTTAFVDKTDIVCTFDSNRRGIPAHRQVTQPHCNIHLATENRKLEITENALKIGCESITHTATFTLALLRGAVV
jgi:hypothetical protein